MYEVYASVVQIFWAYPSGSEKENTSEIADKVKLVLRTAVNTLFEKYDNLTDVSFLAPGEDKNDIVSEEENLVKVKTISDLPDCK